MALTEIIQSSGLDVQRTLIAASSILLGIITAYLYLQRSLGGNSPKLVKGDWPIIGSYRFFSERWDFCREAIAQSATGNFSFHVGKHSVVGLGGDESRKLFLESKDLDFDAGYNTLFAGAPSPPKPGPGEEELTGGHFAKRLTFLLKRENFATGLPLLISDTRKRLDELANDPSGMTDPFDSIYGIVYQLTMRTVAANEIAEDRELIDETLRIFEAVEASMSPSLILFPWLPTPSKLKRYWGGYKLYMIFKKIVDKRIELNKRENDPLQFLMDKGDSITQVIAFVLGALFAGQLNSGINAAWVLLYLARDPYWLGRVREEVEFVADKYDSDHSKKLADRLMSVPLAGWENDFHLVDLCLRDSIRLQALGTMFRQNRTEKSIRIGSEEIPPGAFAVYPLADVHMDEGIYTDPEQWDPSRYLPDRSEDQKKKHAFVGWGAGRHPCLGMRFAKLEQNILVAFFLAYFDMELCNKDGTTGDVQLPKVNINGHSAAKPKSQVYIKYKARE